MIWTVTAIVFAVLLAGCLGACVRGSLVSRAVALQATNVVAVLGLVAVSVVADRAIYLDVAIVLALLGAAGSLAYARLLERWL